MKRILPPLVALLLVGAIINIAVSWALAIWTDSVTFDAQLTAKLRRQGWEIEGRSDRLQQESIWIDQALRGPGLDLVIVNREQPAESVHLYRAGWPFRAMEGESRPTTTGESEYAWAVPLSSVVTLRAELLSATAKVLTSTAARIVPLRPAWLGFLGNTALFAAVAMGMIGFVWLVRRGYLPTLLILLAIGAVINLAVTWALAIWTGSVTFDAQLTAKLRRQGFWATEGRSDRLQPQGVWIEQDQGVWIVQALRGAGLDLVIVMREQPTEIVHLYRAGWPFRAMEGESRPTTTGKPAYASAVPLSSMVTLRAVLTCTATRIVPLRPAWLGFLGNTVLYAVVAMVMIGCAWLVRRAYRRWRGRCIGCGYDLRGDFDRACPECGHKREESVTAAPIPSPPSGGEG